MRFTSNIFVFFFLLLLKTAHSQLSERDYIPVQSTGEIPKEFVLSAGESVDLKLASAKFRGRTKQLNKELITNSHYDLKELFNNGYILLNDTISNYVNSVANIIFKSAPELGGKFRIYVIKSAEVNACCFENGTILVNIGLIAKLENEAQLASILCHEFVHYIKQHSFLRVVTFDKIKRNKTGKRKFEDKALLMYQYSKGNETEADTAGITIFSKTGYDLNDAISALGVLEHSQFPFNTLSLNKSSFNDTYYQLPEKYFLKEADLAVNQFPTDDTYKTHPNIQLRKLQNTECIKKISAKTGQKKFISSEAAFYYVREVCRFECTRLLITERNYTDAFKWAFLLKEKYPENKFICVEYGKCLFALTMYKAGKLKYSNTSYHDNAIGDHRKVQDSSRQVNYLFGQIPDKEFAILTIRYLWNTHLKYPNNKWLVAATDSTFSVLFNRSVILPAEFKRTADSIVSTPYYSLAFTELFKDSIFSQLFKVFSEKKMSQSGISESGLKEFSIAELKTGRKIKTDSIKISKFSMFIVKPSYNYTKEKNDGEYPEISNSKEIDLYADIQKHFKKHDIDYLPFDLDHINSDAIDKYNEHSNFHFWLDERIDGGIASNNSILGVDSITALTNHPEVRYGLVVSVDGKLMKESVGEKLMYIYGWGWLIFPIPIVLYQIAHPPEHLNINISLINLRTGELIKTESHSGAYRNPDRHLNKKIKKFVKKIYYN